MAESMQATDWFSANGKVILFGEHAVVYGVEAVAAAVPDLVRARAFRTDDTYRLKIPHWHVDMRDFQKHEANASETELLRSMFFLIAGELAVDGEFFGLEVDARVPPASGLGASAALAVAATKALANLFELRLNLSEINDIAFKCEQLAHGTPSGLDNTLATFGGVLRFRRENGAAVFAPVPLASPIELLIALSGKKGFTAGAVAKVRDAKNRDPQRYQGLFADIARLSAEGIIALAESDTSKLASLFNQNQRYLAEMDLSCDEIEQVLTIAASAGCNGGKLTGSGDGGAVILLAEEGAERIESSLNAAGFSTLKTVLGAKSSAFVQG